MSSPMQHIDSCPVDETFRPTRIYTTFRRVRDHYEGMDSTTKIHSVNPDSSVWDLFKLYWSLGPADRLVFNGDARQLSLVALLKRLMPGRHGKLIAVDLVLRVPNGIKARLAARLRRWLWREVDLFIHYFRDLKGYERHFGINHRNSTYTPFKSNLYQQAIALQTTLRAAEGEYIFSAGRSLRDYQTLVEAARITGLPVAILFTSHQDWAAHGSFLDTKTLPDNVSLIQDDGSQAGWLEGLKRARLVVVPTLPESVCASGIGTYLDAMALGKPVIITRGPGADDILNTEQARFVPPSDAQALAAAMQQLWDDRDQARRQAEQGRDYALGLGDEQALLQRIFNIALTHS